ncbi:hypothetical protein V6N11_026389 [Hibiscus sabdariffa]|uniref:Uncharacterized protein n=1 Tax=Hibiscus sabdariffa TaxID=183260 RepID=A0ABR2SWB8_9ROSI
MLDHTRSKVDSFLNPGMLCNLRTNQNMSKEAINAFCLTSYDSKQERSLSQVVPLIKPCMSFSSDSNQTCRDFGYIPLEVLHVVKAWSNQLSPLALKRKREFEDSFFPLTTDKMILRDMILEGVIECEPGIWKSTGSGLIENDEVVNFVFASGFKE